MKIIRTQNYLWEKTSSIRISGTKGNRGLKAIVLLEQQSFRFRVQREPKNMIKLILVFRILISVGNILNTKVSCFLYLIVYCIVITSQIYQIFLFAKHVKNIKYFLVFKQVLLCDNDTKGNQENIIKLYEDFWLKWKVCFVSLPSFIFSQFNQIFSLYEAVKHV